jgi:hypothetical protein
LGKTIKGKVIQGWFPEFETDCGDLLTAVPLVLLSSHEKHFTFLFYGRLRKFSFWSKPFFVKAYRQGWIIHPIINLRGTGLG